MNYFSNAANRVNQAIGLIGQSLAVFGLSEYSESNRQDYIRKVMMDINSPALLEEALNHRDHYSLRRWENESPRKYSFFCSSTWKIGEYSIGFALHFMLLKQLIVLMFLISCASAILLYFNYNGNYYEGSEVQSVLDYFTIGNINGDRKHLNYTETVGAEKVDDNYQLVWTIDSSCSGFFLLCILLFFTYAYVYVFDMIKKVDRISDYTVEVKGLPRTGVDPEELKQHFRRFGDVVEVFLGRRFGKFLPLYTEKFRINEERMIREALIKFKKEVPEEDKALKKLAKKLSKSEEKIKKQGALCQHENMEIKRAYVVFNRTNDKIICLKAYNRRNACGCKKRSRKLRFQKIHLTVMPSTEPTDIIWENLEYSKSSRICRRIVSLFFTLLLLALSIAMIYYVKTAQSRLPSEDKCSKLDVEKKGSSDSGDQRLCYCQSLSSKHLIDNTSDCYVYIEYLSYAWGIKFLSGFGIMLVNFLLKTIMRKLTDFEKPISRSHIQIRVFKKIFMVIFINTAILTYIVNLSIPDISKYTLEGEYKDFTREWFLRVGSYLLTLMLISLFSPHIIYLMLAYPIGACRRKFCFRGKKTQYELNILFTGPEFDIAARTAQILNVIFTCYLYSGGIPLLNCTCFVFLLIIFYTDKWLVLRHFKKPPKYDSTLYVSVIKILPFCVILHCAVSLYVYGNPEIFPVKFDEIDIIHEIFPSNIAKRLEKPSGIINCLLILSALAILLILGFLDLICKCCLKRRMQAVKSESDFLSIKEELEKKGLVSYDIRNNPNYAMIINEMDESAGLRPKDNINYFERAKLAREFSKLSRENSQGHLTSTNRNLERKSLGNENLDSKRKNDDFDHLSSEDLSYPDLSRDEQAEIDLEFNSIKSSRKPKKIRSSDNNIAKANEIEKPLKKPKKPKKVSPSESETSVVINYDIEKSIKGTEKSKKKGSSSESSKSEQIEEDNIGDESSEDEDSESDESSEDISN